MKAKFWDISKRAANRSHTLGSVFYNQEDGTYYVLANVGPLHKVALISLDDEANRWEEAVEVKNLNKITAAEFESMTGQKYAQQFIYTGSFTDVFIEKKKRKGE